MVLRQKRFDSLKYYNYICIWVRRKIMIKENVNGFNMLVTNGDEKDVSTKDKYCSHLWIHNNILNKNHTSLKYDVGRFMTESEIIFIKTQK